MHSSPTRACSHCARAARVALVVPLVFAFFLNGVDNSIAALFAGFGSFALLGFADFGGPTRPRGGAYLALTGVGAVLVVLGTLVCNEPIVAALIGVVVATAVRFAGCFGGYFAASVSPLILGYVLAASVPAPMDAIPDRVLGWIVAGLAATVAGVVLWPRRERLLLREAAAATADAVADAVAGLAEAGGPPTDVIDAMNAAVNELATTGSVPQRPAGPSAHDAALAFLVDQLERAAGFVRVARRDAEITDQTAALATLTVKVLRQIGTTLRTGAAPADLDALVASCLDTKRAAMDHAVHELERGEDADAVIEDIDALFTERLLLLLSASALSNASIVVGGDGPSDDRSHDPARGAAHDGRSGDDGAAATSGGGQRGPGIGLGTAEPAGRHRGGRGDPDRRRAPPGPRLLGGARHAVGVALERVRHRAERADGCARHGDRIRRVRRLARRRRVR